MKLKLYFLIETLLFFILLVFQIIYLAQSYSLKNTDGDLFIFIAIFHVLITLVSFLFVSYLFIINRNQDRIREDLFIIYFLFTLIADIFFSFTKYIFIGHIAFVLSYLVYMVIRKAKIYEYIAVVSIGIIGIVLLIVVKKLNLVMGIDSFLAPILALNMIMSIVKYVKNKDLNNLVLMIALITIFFSDICVGLSGLLNPDSIITNISCLLVWPTYVLGCCLLNLNYSFKRKV